MPTCFGSSCTAWIVVTKPGVQNPHWLPWQSTIARWTFESEPSSSFSPSTVTTWARSAW